MLSNDYIKGYTEGRKNGYDEGWHRAIDEVTNLMIDMLNDGTIETKDIGKVNMMIRGLCGD